jgi:hypothetical protein
LARTQSPDANDRIWIPRRADYIDSILARIKLKRETVHSTRRHGDHAEQPRKRVLRAISAPPHLRVKTEPRTKFIFARRHSRRGRWWMHAPLQWNARHRAMPSFRRNTTGASVPRWSLPARRFLRTRGHAGGLGTPPARGCIARRGARPICNRAPSRYISGRNIRREYAQKFAAAFVCALLSSAW